MAALLTTLLPALSWPLLARLTLLLLPRLLTAALLTALLAALVLLARLLRGFILLHGTSFRGLRSPAFTSCQRAASPRRSRFCWRQNIGNQRCPPVFLIPWKTSFGHKRG